MGCRGGWGVEEIEVRAICMALSQISNGTARDEGIKVIRSQIIEVFLCLLKKHLI